MICYNCSAPLVGKLKCTECGHYNTGSVQAEHKTKAGTLINGTILLSNVTSVESERISTGPWDHIWGVNYKDGKSGIVPTSVTLLAGAPGAGKSTLLLQIADKACEVTNQESGYLAGEEPLEQIHDRAVRLELKNLSRIRMIPAMSGTVDIQSILNQWKFGLFILDSLNGLAGKDMRVCVDICKIIKVYSMNNRVPAIVVSHITKQGDIAGLEALQHEVDATFSFFPLGEGLGDEAPRELVVEKNRNGQAFQKMHLRMTAKGLQVWEDVTSVESERISTGPWDHL